MLRQHRQHSGRSDYLKKREPVASCNRQSALSTLFIIVVLALLISSPAWSKTIRVSTTPPRDFSTVQSAINSASAGDVITVTAGTYKELLVFQGRDIELLGGYSPDFSTRDIVQYETVLDGNNGGVVIHFRMSETNLTKLDGFTIRNGSAYDGGGIDVTNKASPIISNNIITGNRAGNAGGGICIHNGSNSTAIIRNNLISNNNGTWGGGIFCGSNVTISNNTIAKNTASGGGGILCESLLATIKNNVIVENTGRASNSAGGIACRYGASPTITFCNVWNNTGGDYYQCNQTMGKLQQNPKFVDPSKNDYRLQPGSPCIDTGDPTILDPDGSRSDMGAYGGPAAYQESAGPLIAWWTFDEGTGTTAADSSSNSYDSTLENGPTWTTGKYDNAIQLDGNDDFIKAPIHINSNGSISFWFKANTWRGRHGRGTGLFCDSDNNFGLWRGSDERFRFYSGGNNLWPTIMPVTNHWYHVIITWTTQKQCIYFNGNLSDFKEGNFSYTFVPPFQIGKWYKGNFVFSNFNGSVDDFKIFSKELSASEVKYEYEGLVAYYKFDESSGTSAKDETVNDNDGKLINGPIWQPNIGKFEGSLNFDGLNDYVRVENSQSLITTKTLTIAFWLSIESKASDYSHPIGMYDSDSSRKWHSYTVYIKPNSTTLIWKFSSIGGSRKETDIGDILLDRFTHVAVTYDSTMISGYINGELKESDTASGEISISESDPLGIGCTDIVLDQKYFKGLIDDVRIYRRALSPDEIYDIAGLNVITYVNNTIGSDKNNGSSSEIPKKTIQAGINATRSGGIVEVAAGTYDENIIMKSNITLLGGFNPMQWTRNIYDNTTIINGLGATESVILCNKIEDAVISGFTISGGSGTNLDGGGILCSDSTNITVTNNIITNNSASRWGAGISFQSSSGEISKNIIDTNNSENCGGGVHFFLSSPSFFNNTVYANSAAFGGGVYSVSSSPVMKNNIITYNIASASYGGLGYVNTNPTVDYNNIWDNKAPDSPDIGYSGVGASEVVSPHSISSEPGFTDPNNGNFNLKRESPCIDAGDPTFDPDSDGTWADMGALPYFHPPDPPCWIDAGDWPNDDGSQGIIIRWTKSLSENFGIITTVVGTGEKGYDNDNVPAIDAKIWYPHGLDIDNSRNLYIADRANYRVRKVDTSGIISTHAGGGIYHDDAWAILSYLNWPDDVCTDNFGNTFVALSRENRIRKIYKSGYQTQYGEYSITTIAGIRNAGGYNDDNIKATSATLSSPSGVCTDKLGNIYIADTGNNRIRKVDFNGIISTVVGTETSGYNGDDILATSAQLSGPTDLCIDKLGNIYIADTENHRIRKVGLDGIITTIAGTGSAGYTGDGFQATFSQLSYPTDVYLDYLGNLHVIDRSNYRVRKVTTNGKLITVVGTGTSGFNGDNIQATDAQISWSRGLCVDITGNIYISDLMNNRVRKVKGPLSRQVTEYKIYRRTDDDLNWQIIQTRPVGDYVYLDSDVQPDGTVYFYRVTAVDTEGRESEATSATSAVCVNNTGYDANELYYWHQTDWSGGVDEPALWISTDGYRKLVSLDGYAVYDHPPGKLMSALDTTNTYLVSPPFDTGAPADFQEITWMGKPQSVEDNLLFSEDFEQYTVNSFPSDNWVLVFNGAGTSKQEIIEHPVDSSSQNKIIKLHGKANYNGVIRHEIASMPDNVIIELDIFSATTATSVLGYNWGGVFLDNGTNHLEVEFSTNASSILAQSNDNNPPHSETPSQTNEWYHLAIQADFTNSMYTLWVDGTLVGTGKSMYPHHTEAGSSAAIVLFAGNDTDNITYFDNVKLYEGYYTPGMFKLRTTPDTDNSGLPDWSSPSATAYLGPGNSSSNSSWYTISGTPISSDHDGHNWIQYKVLIPAPVVPFGMEEINWQHDILVTYATNSIEYGKTNGVFYLKGGIDNGGGGDQVYYADNGSFSDISVYSWIRLEKNPNHVNTYGDSPYIRAGVTGRYQSTGKGYGTALWYETEPSKVQFKLVRLDGTQSTAFGHTTIVTDLVDPLLLPNFDPTVWHFMELELSGNEITAKLDGITYLKTSDDTYSSGYPGLLFPGSDGGGWAFYEGWSIPGQLSTSSPNPTHLNSVTIIYKADKSAPASPSVISPPDVMINDKITLSGSCDSKTTDLLISGVNTVLTKSFPSEMTWDADVAPYSGENMIAIKGVSSSGTLSTDSTKVTITYVPPENTTTTKSAFQTTWAFPNTTTYKLNTHSGAWDWFDSISKRSDGIPTAIYADFIVPLNYNIGPNTITNGLVGYWPFDTDASDTSVNGNHGTVNGATHKPGEGIWGGCYYFDGVDDYITIGQNPNFPSWSTYTVSVWFLDNGTGDNKNYGDTYGAKIIDKTTLWHDWYLSVRGPHVRFHAYEGSRNGNFETKGYDYRDSKWHHATVVKNGNDEYLYVDGILIDDDDSAKTVYSNADLIIGYCLSSDAGQRAHFGGYIDEVSIYNRALNAEEIAQLAGAYYPTTELISSPIDTSNWPDGEDRTQFSTLSWTSPSKPPKPQADEDTVALWHFDGDSSDASGNGNNGTVNGATFEDGKFGKALQFDGSDDYVVVPYSTIFNIDEELTIESWVYFSNLVGTQSILTKLYQSDGSNANDAYGLQMRFEGNLDAYLTVPQQPPGGQPVISSRKVMANQWQHVALVYHHVSGVTFYIDGIQAGHNTECGGVINVTDKAIVIGAKRDHVEGYNHFFSGLIDEVRVSNIARTPEEIALAAGIINPGVKLALRSAPEEVNPVTTPSEWGPWMGSLIFEDQFNYKNTQVWNYTSVANMDSKKLVLGNGSDDHPELDTKEVHTLPYVVEADFLNLDYPNNNSWKMGFNIHDYNSSSRIMFYLQNTGYRIYVAHGLSTKIKDINVTNKPKQANTWYNLKLSVDGQTVQAFIDGEQVQTFSYSPPYGDTFIRLESWGNYGQASKARVDNFRVSNLYYESTHEKNIIADHGAVFHYRFEENEYTENGDTLTISKGSNGTGCTFIPGKIGTAIEFDGIDDYIQTSFTPVITQDDSISISFWFKASKIQDGNNIFGLEKTGGHEFVVHIERSDPKLVNFRFRDDDNHPGLVTSNTAIDEGVWYHCGAVRDAESKKLLLYLNGVLDATANDITTTSLNKESPRWMAIGAGNNSTFGIRNYFNGTVDEFKIYNYARSADQIAEDYASSAMADSPTTWYVPVNPAHDGHRWLQYKAILENITPQVPPILSSVTINCWEYVGRKTPDMTTPKIAFYSNRDGHNEIYVMDSDGSNQMNLTNNSADDGHPFFSPDGTKIAFHSNRDGNYEIYVMDFDGSNPVNLTNNSAYDEDPCFSPDGTKIAFSSYRDGNVEIYIMNFDGSNQVNLTETNNSAHDMGPCFSPDGTKIAFYSQRDSLNCDIYIINSDGSNPVRLTTHSGSDTSPCFSPDGTMIAFNSSRGGYNTKIHVMGSDGSNPTMIPKQTNNSASNTAACFPPDGTKIAFYTQRDGNYEIYVMNSDGSNPVNLTNNGAKDLFPCWWAPKGITPQTWHKFPINPVLKPTSGRFDSLQAYDPCVIKDDDGYKMWYQGHNGGRWRLGYANSDDGIRWTKYQGQGTDGSIFEGGIDIENPCVIEDDGKYRLYWADYPYIMMTESSDATGLNWISNPLVAALPAGSFDMSPGANTKFDKMRVSTPWVLKISETYHMWYGGKDADGWDIGYATSSDSITWTKRYGDGPYGSVVWHGMDENFEADEVNGPRVIYKNGYFMMWYGGERDGKWDAIGFAYSKDGKNWTNVKGSEEGGATLTVGGARDFDSYLAFAPCVIQDEGVYKMWYRGAASSGIEGQIGYARTKTFTLEELQEFDNTPPVIESVEIGSGVPDRFYPGPEDFPVFGATNPWEYFLNSGIYYINPKNGGENQAITVTVDWSDDFPSKLMGSGAFGGGPVEDNDASGGWVLTYTVPETATGSYPVTITCEDQAGNQLTEDFTFFIDIASPTGGLPALVPESDVTLSGYPGSIQLPHGVAGWFYRSTTVFLSWAGWNDSGGSGLPPGAYWSKLFRTGSHEFTNPDSSWMEDTGTSLTFGTGSEDGSTIRMARVYARDNVGNENYTDSPDILHDTVAPTVEGLAVEAAPDNLCALTLANETDPAGGGTLWYNPSQDITVTLKPSWSDLNLYLAALEPAFGQIATPHEPGSGSSAESELPFTITAGSGDAGDKQVYLVDKAGNNTAVPLALKADTEPPVINGPIGVNYLSWKPAGFPGPGIARRAASAAGPAIITVPESSVSDTLSGVREIRSSGTDINPGFTLDNGLMIHEEGPPRQYKYDVTPSGVSGAFSTQAILVAADLVDNQSQPAGSSVEVDMVRPAVNLLAPLEGGWDDGSVLVRWVANDTAPPTERFLLHKVIRFTSLVDGAVTEVPLTPLEPFDTFSDENKNRLRLEDGGGWHTVVLKGDSGETGDGDPMNDYLDNEGVLVPTTAYSVEFEVVDAGGNSAVDTVNYWEYKPEKKEEGDLLAAGEKVDERPENLYIQAPPDGTGGGGDVYFVTYSYGDADIVRIGLDGFGYNKVAAFTGSEEFSPTVTPDGKWLIFLSNMAAPPQKTGGGWRATTLGVRAVWGKNLADGTVKLLVGQTGVSEVTASVCPLQVFGFEGTYLLAHVTQEPGRGAVKIVALDEEAQPVGEEIEVLGGAWIARCSLQWRTVNQVPCLVITGTERVGSMQSNRFVASVALRKNRWGTLTAKRLRSPIRWQGALASASLSESGWLYASSPKAVKPHQARSKIWRFAPQLEGNETEAARGAIPNILLMQPALMTCGDGDDTDPAISPDGELLAFSSLRASRGTWDAVSPDQGEIDASVTDRDREIFITAGGTPLRLNPGVTGNEALKTEDENGLNQLTANMGKDDHSPRFTPEGGRVVYFSKVRSTGLTDIRIINVPD